MQEGQRGLTGRSKVKLQRASKTSDSGGISIFKTFSLLRRLRSEYSKENCTYLRDEVPAIYERDYPWLFEIAGQGDPILCSQVF